jgi:16S rRNA (cytosine1402-N4)-methyltransferase
MEYASEGDWFSDLTFGAGGHTFAILQRSETYRVLSFDQDPEAYKNGLELLEKNKIVERVKFANTNFKNFDQTVLEKFGEDFEGFRGIVVDLGVSSHHFDKSERGFSFRFDGPLDMRMDTEKNPLTAEEIVNEYYEEDLFRIIKEYGEERFTKRIVQNILEKRKDGRITTTKELENLIFHSYPKNMRHSGIHPATRTFQALRIEVNKELDVLTDVLSQLIKWLRPGGRISAISFHSLEDRIVKHAFKAFAKEDKNLEILTKKPILASEKELQENTRSRSAKMRVLQRKLDKTEEKG